MTKEKTKKEKSETPKGGKLKVVKTKPKLIYDPKKKYKKTKCTKAELEKAIAKHGGNVLQVSLEVKVDWHTAKKYIKEFELEDYCKECDEIMKDMAETNVFNDLNKGDGWTTRWFLSTKGKDRGYISRAEIDDLGKGAELKQATQTGEELLAKLKAKE